MATAAPAVAVAAAVGLGGWTRPLSWQEEVAVVGAAVPAAARCP